MLYEKFAGHEKCRADFIISDYSRWQQNCIGVNVRFHSQYVLRRFIIARDRIRMTFQSVYDKIFMDNKNPRHNLIE